MEINKVGFSIFLGFLYLRLGVLVFFFWGILFWVLKFLMGIWFFFRGQKSFFFFWSVRFCCWDGNSGIGFQKKFFRNQIVFVWGLCVVVVVGVFGLGGVLSDILFVLEVFKNYFVQFESSFQGVYLNFGLECWVGVGVVGVFLQCLWQFG